MLSSLRKLRLAHRAELSQRNRAEPHGLARRPADHALLRRGLLLLPPRHRLHHSGRGHKRHRGRGLLVAQSVQNHWQQGSLLLPTAATSAADDGVGSIRAAGQGICGSTAGFASGNGVVGLGVGWLSIVVVRLSFCPSVVLLMLKPRRPLPSYNHSCSASSCPSTAAAPRQSALLLGCEGCRATEPGGRGLRVSRWASAPPRPP